MAPKIVPVNFFCYPNGVLLFICAARIALTAC
jgi:hypothetical protein